MIEARTQIRTVVLSSLLLAGIGWAAAGAGVWAVETVRQGFVAAGHSYLAIWTGARIYARLLPMIGAAGVALALVVLAARLLPERRRRPVLIAIVAAATLAALLVFGYRLNRFTLVGFWKGVRNAGALPGATETLRVLAANAGLAALVLFHGLLIARRAVALAASPPRPAPWVRRVAPAALAIPLLVLAGARFLRPSPEGPNVLVIALDTVRQDHLTSCGYPRETAPHLARLGKEGVLFARTLSQAPWTLSSFASILTGLYPSTHGAYIGTERRLLTRDHVPYLGKRASTAAEVFKNGGYATACEATNTYLRFGLEQGYDHARVELRGAGEVTDAMLDWLGANAGRPFFAFLHFNDAHGPGRTPEPYDRLFPTGDEREHTGDERWRWLFTGGEELEGEAFRAFREHKTALYDGSIRYIDAEIGRVLDWLERRDLADRTVVVVLSDHGEEFWEHAGAEKEVYDDPRGFYGVGHGHTLFDEQLRLFLLIRGPGVPVNRVIPNQVRAIDLAPTLFEIAGLGAPRGVEGRSLLPVWEGREREDRPALAEAIIFGSDRRAVIRDGYKYVFSPDEPHLLYDLDADPGETRNLIGLETDRAAALFTELEAYMEKHPRGEESVRSGIDEETFEELRALGYVD
ncbi:MAG: sulfatase [Candidatus Eisenbacteria bacterium]|nr:sulfatase [Candidatus Eisenbacteria bacterium]